MTDADELAMWRRFGAEFADGVAAFLATNPAPSHGAHRFLDEHWTLCTQRLPADHPVRVQTSAWMAMIEGYHVDDAPYPARGDVVALPPTDGVAVNNLYHHRFVVECPNNGVKIAYALTIETPNRIFVEDIVAACDVRSAFHEDLADALATKFGGRQTMRAYHHGVWITTLRGAA